MLPAEILDRRIHGYFWKKDALQHAVKWHIQGISYTACDVRVPADERKAHKKGTAPVVTCLACLAL